MLSYQKPYSKYSLPQCTNHMTGKNHNQYDQFPKRHGHRINSRHMKLRHNDNENAIFFILLRTPKCILKAQAKVPYNE